MRAAATAVPAPGAPGRPRPPRPLARALAAGAAALALLLAAAPASAQSVLLERRPPRPTPVPSPGPGAVALECRDLSVTARIEDRVARVEVSQVFFNPSHSEQEGTYLFVLPEGAAVERFSMWVDGKELAGELLEAARAREIYEAIVRARRDPALLEFLGRRLFRARIFPIEPRSEKRVRLAYTELLEGDSGAVTWRFPLARAAAGGSPPARASVAATVRTARRLAAVFSPSHALDVARDGDRGARASWEGRDGGADRDFTLLVQETAADMAMSFAAERPAGEDGAFLFLLAPGSAALEKPVPRDLVLVVDTSGSMAGPKMEQARGALRHALRTLGPDDRFGIVAFATATRPFREALLPATAENVAAAVAFADSLQAVGGTNIGDALAEGLRLLAGGDAARPGVLLFATDGLPTVGERDPAVLLAAARKAASARVRAFAFGVGYDVHTRLLDGLAAELRGARDYVAPEEDVEAKVSALVEKTRHAVVTDLEVKVEGVAAFDLCPGRLPDLFLGGEVAVLGRYTGEGSAVLRVRGRTPSGPREWVHEVVFPRAGGEGTGVARLWAVRRIGALLDEIRLRGESKEVVAEIVRLARRHGVLTPYTSWLVLEDEARAQPGDRAGGGGARDDLGRRLHDLAGAGATPPDAPGFAGAPTGAKAGADAADPRADSGEASVRRSLEAKRMAEARDGDEPLEEEAKDARRRLREVARSVSGRTFFLRGDRWVEAGLSGDETRRRVRAWSEEHLALARRDAATAGALALGRVVLRVGDEVVEIEEDPAGG